MGIYKYLRETWKKPTSLIRQKSIKWRKQPAVLKIDRPTRLDRARSLGYKAKRGIIIARVRIKRGGRKRSQTYSKQKLSKHSRRKSKQKIP